MNELKASKKSGSEEEKEQKKAEKIAAMMAGFDSVRNLILFRWSITHTVC